MSRAGADPATRRRAVTRRLRILVAGECDAATWAQWQSALAQRPECLPRMSLQRVPSAPRADVRGSVGLGYGETVRWFGPVEDAQRRRLLVDYAACILQEERFPALPAGLRELSLAAPLQGIVLLSHAETDLLALERARTQLPADFPPVTGHSLNAITGPDALSSLLGACNEPDLVVIARVHGPVASVPGLAPLITQAQAEGWSLAAVSGVGASLEPESRTSNMSCELVDRLTAYFQAGGSHNVAQALRYVAHEHLGLQVSFEPVRPMPQHGLYHPDLLVTTAAEWADYRFANGDPPTAAVLFYRAHVLSGNLSFIDQMIRALESRGCGAIGIFTSSLREVDASGVPLALGELPQAPEIVVNTVSYPVVSRSSLDAEPVAAHCFETVGVPFLQAVCCTSPRDVWVTASHGLSPVEAAMNVALPECDGRVITVPISFKEDHRYRPDAERIRRVADLAHRFIALRRKRNAEKKIAVVLSNSGGKAQGVGGAIGLDTPASLLSWLVAMRGAGYQVGTLPATPGALLSTLLAEGCYDERHPLNASTPWRMPRAHYREWFLRQAAGFQKSIRDVWSTPSTDSSVQPATFWRGDQRLRRPPLLAGQEPNSDRDSYLFCGLQLGNVFIAIQPPRAFGIDADTAYHSQDLPPCHHYAAFYRWLAEIWGADALVHFGAHGTLEWLPGKSLALSSECAPDVLLADLPLFYPFVMNNPGEGAQAKRRTHAVIVDHLVPPLTHAECGPLASLARLVEEYYRTEVLDPDKLPQLQRQIWEHVCAADLAADLRELRRERHGSHEHVWDDRLTSEGAPRALERLTARGFAHLIEDLDTYLCDLGRAQIRGGLHTFGTAPEGAQLVDLVFAILRSPNGRVASLTDAVARACGIRPVALRECRGVWPERKPPALALEATVTSGQVRTAIDDLARRLLTELEVHGFAVDRVAGLVTRTFPDDVQTGDVPDTAAGNGLRDLTHTLQFACQVLVPNIARTSDEVRHLLQGLDGKYVPAGPAGAPSRGMAHTLPTGRNFYTFDPRALPTRTAWTTGEELARQLLARHVADAGGWPENIAMSIWGTPTLRTGGDEIAQALALLGVRPVWDAETHRTCGLEIIPLAELGRPRIDVTLRVSGFFRDALAVLTLLFDDAVRRVALLEEPPEQNFVRKHWQAAHADLLARGVDSAVARRRASYRVFGPRPGAYGTGLLQLVEGSRWTDARDLARVTVSSTGWAYGEGSAVAATDDLRRLLECVDLVVQCQDSREQDLFDSTDYFEFHGGLAAAAAWASGRSPAVYCADSSEPGQPRVRTLQLEALRVFRSRVVNPKWLAAMQRHGHRGGLEMVVTVDCLFGYAATTGVVTDWMFEAVAASFAGEDARRFLERCNPWALNSIAERLLEAEHRGLWMARPDTSAALRGALLESEAALEGPPARSAARP